jgi:hypothetical protein
MAGGMRPVEDVEIQARFNCEGLEIGYGGVGTGYPGAGEEAIGLQNCCGGGQAVWELGQVGDDEIELGAEFVEGEVFRSQELGLLEIQQVVADLEAHAIYDVALPWIEATIATTEEIRNQKPAKTERAAADIEDVMVLA